MSTLSPIAWAVVCGDEALNNALDASGIRALIRVARTCKDLRAAVAQVLRPVRVPGSAVAGCLSENGFRVTMPGFTTIAAVRKARCLCIAIGESNIRVAAFGRVLPLASVERDFWYVKQLGPQSVYIRADADRARGTGLGVQYNAAERTIGVVDSTTDARAEMAFDAGTIAE